MIAMCAAFVSVHAQDPQWHDNAACDSLYHYTCDCGCHNHLVNNYSGLNSLRERLANRSWDGRFERSTSWGLSLDGSSSDNASYGNNGSGSYGNNENDFLADGTNGNVSSDGRWIRWDNADEKSMDYLSGIVKGELPVGAPVYFFFNLASTNLTDKSQLINLDAIAELAKQWHLTVRVTGAADSATGSTDGNVSLSKSRTDYISRILQERGVPGEKIQTVAEGGIEKFIPAAANRQCKVELMIP